MSEPTPERPSRLRRWGKRLLRAAVIVFLLLAALRFVALALLPGVLADIGRESGLEIRYERLDVSLTTLDVELWNLVVDEQKRPGPPPFLDVEYLRADIALSDLLLGDLVVHRIELDGAIGHVHRLADGRWSITSDGEPVVARAESTDAEAATDAIQADDTAAPEADDARLSFEPPAALRALRVQHVELHVHDAAVDPPRELVVSGDVRVSNVGLTGRRTKFSAVVSSAPHVGLVRVSGEATTGADELSTELDVALVDLRPRVFADELTALGLQPLTESLALDLGLQLELVREDDDHFTGNLGVTGLALTADGDAAATIGAIEVPVAALTAQGLALGDVVVRDVATRSLSDRAGLPVVAGLRLVPTGRTPTPRDTSPPGAPFGVALASLRVENVDLRHALLATAPVTDLALSVDALALDAFAWPADDTQPLDLRLAAALPGLVETLELEVDGELGPDDGRVGLALRGDDVHLRGLAAILRDAGLRTTLVDGRLTLDAEAAWTLDDDGRLAADLAVTQVALDDGDGTRLVGLGPLRVDGLTTPASDGDALRIADVTLAGLEGSVWRDADGSWRGLGFAPLGDTPAPAGTAAALTRIARRALDEPTPPAPPAPPAPPTPSAPTPLAVERVALDASGLVLNDALRTRTVRVDRLDLDADALRIDDGTPRVASLTLGLGASHALRDLKLALTWTEDADRLGLDGRLDANGLSLVDVADDLGLEDVWLRDGSLAAQVSTSWRTTDAGFEIGGRIDDLALRQDGVDLLAFDALVLDGATFGADTRIEAVEWDAPRIALTRLDDGRLELLGITTGGAAAADDTSPSSAPDAPSDDAPPGGGGLVSRATIRGAGVDWTDATGSSRVDLDVDVTRLGWGDAAGPADVSLALAIPDALDRLGIDGVVDTNPDALGVALTLDGRGMRAGPLDRYLPDGVALRWDDATLSGAIDALWARHPDGGHRAEVAIDDLRLADADHEYLALPELRVDAPRIDPAARTYDVDALTLRGLRTFANREADGDIEVLGVFLSGGESDEAVVDAASADEDDDARERVREALRQRLVDRASLDTPIDVDVASVDLQIERAEFGDEGAPEPYVIRDLRISTTRPVLLPDEPVAVRIEGGVSPVVERLAVDTTLDARAVPAKINVDLEAEGVRAPGTPDTAESRAVRASLGAEWSSARGAPLQYDEKRGLTLSAFVRDLAVSDAPGGEARLGFDRLLVDSLRFQPLRGLLTVDAIMLERPVADVLRDAEGLSIGGLRLPASDAADDAAPDDLADASEDASADEPGLAVRIESAIVSGIDAVYEDTTTTPPTLLPIDDIDFEVRSIDVDRIPYGHEMPFALFVRGGEVPAGTLRPTDDEAMRVFGGIEVNGELGVAPTLDGNVDLAVYGLELTALAGLAAESGITLRDGTLDVDAHYTFRGERGLDARNQLIFTDLAASEPSGGVLSQVLLLSVPLRAVIAILRDEVGVIELNVNFSSGAEGLSLGEIARLGATTLSQQLARAIANSPFKVLGLGANVAGQVTSLTGLSDVLDTTTRMMGVDDLVGGGGEDVPVALALSFMPGVAEPIGSFEDTILAWCDLMSEDPTLLITLTHEVGTTDIARMTERLDPPDDELRAAVDDLRTRRATLLEELATLRERARTVHAVSRTPESDPVVVRLGRLTEELGLVERTLDATLELLGPTGERRAELRIAKGCIALAEARLQGVRDRMLDNEVVASRLESLFTRRSAREWSKRIRIQRPRYEPDEDLTTSRVVVALQRRGP